MEKISSWPAVFVHPAGRVERGDAVLHCHVPFTLVDERVMVATEQDGIVDRRVAAVRPMTYMVAVALSGRSAAAGSALSALAEFPRLRFSRPPAEPDVRLSTHPALHEVMPVCLCSSCLPNWSTV